MKECKDYKTCANFKEVEESNGQKAVRAYMKAMSCTYSDYRDAWSWADVVRLYPASVDALRIIYNSAIETVVENMLQRDMTASANHIASLKETL